MTDEELLQALTDFAGKVAIDGPIKILMIAPGGPGVAHIQFGITSTHERFGLHVPLASSPPNMTLWSTAKTATPKKWAKAFYRWLSEQAEARYFGDTARIPYLTIDGDTFRVAAPRTSSGR